MPRIPPVDALVHIADVVFDRSNAQLLRDDQVVALRPKAQALLEALVERPGRIVTKNELLDAVWPDVTVGDAVLKVCVRELRQALGDDSRSPRFIETVHRRGYRWLVEPEAPAVAPVLEKVVATPGGLGDESPLVGREAAWSELTDAFAKAESGTRRVAFISADAGLGKSSLLDAFVSVLAERDDVWVARGPSSESFVAGEAYLPVLTALGEWARGTARTELADTLRRVAPTWLDAMPLLQEPSDRARLAGEVFGATRERMLREIADALEVLAVDRTLVLAFDDLHWADDSTVALLSALASRPGPARLLVVVTQRPIDVIVRRHPARQVQRAVMAGGVGCTITLELLSLREVEGWLAARLGADVPESFATWIHGHTDGHPLFLVQVLDWVIERGLVTRDASGGWRAAPENELAGAVPDGLRSLIEAVADTCDDDEREVLSAAAVAGTAFPSEAVAAALARPTADVESTCDALVDRGAWLVAEGSHVLPDGTLTARYRFGHSLVRQVLFEQLPSTRRARWHHRIAQRGVEVYGDQAEAIACELALHFVAAGDTDAAVEQSRIAARTCSRRLAHDEAIGHLTRALALFDESVDALRAETQLTLLDELGRAARASGDMVTATEHFEMLERRSVAAGDTTRAANAALLSASARSWFDREGCLEAVDRARGFAASVAPHDDVLTAHVEGSAAYWRLMWDGVAAGDQEIAEQSVDVIERLGTERKLGQHLTRFALMCIASGRIDDGIDAAQRGRRLARSNGEVSDDLTARWFLGWARIQKADYSTARDELDAAVRDAENNGHQLWAVLFGALRAWADGELGEVETARVELEALVIAARDLDHAFGERLATALLDRFEDKRVERDHAGSLMGWLLDGLTVG